LTYLVNQTVSFFAYGMPSASSNYVAQKRKAKEEGEMVDKVT
jgi:hypothetical protein